MPVMEPDFYKKLLEVTSAVQMKPEDLLNVMAVESGIDPSAHNPNGNASGLIQFMPSTLKNLGFKGSHADFRNLTAEDQLDYVKKLIENNMRFNGGPFKSAAQYYVANFLPVALKLPGIKQENPNTIIVAKNPNKPHLPGVSIEMEKKYYAANPALDYDHDGAITYGDIQSVLNRAAAGKNFRSAVTQLQNTTGYQPRRPAPSMLATKTPTPTGNLFALLDQYLKQIIASPRKTKQLYKQYLPENCMTIKISAEDFTNASEFARILCLALDEELLSTSTMHTNGQEMEVQCFIHGPAEICCQAVQQLTNALSETFQDATYKIGGVVINTRFIADKRSSYQPTNIKSMELQRRKFLLKFAQKERE